MKKLVLSALALDPLCRCDGRAAGRPCPGRRPDRPDRALAQQAADQRPGPQRPVRLRRLRPERRHRPRAARARRQQEAGQGRSARRSPRTSTATPPASTSCSSDIYAGATAKAAAFAQVTGADASKFGGVDLVKRLNRRVANEKPIAGRIQDKAAGDDFANVIGQAFAVQALTDGEVERRPPRSLKFLLAQQCRTGYFRLNFTADKTAADQTCDGGKRRTTSAPDTDATALAVLSLLGAAEADPGGQGAIDEGGGLAGEAPGQERQLRRRPVDRGAQRQQHRSGRVGARLPPVPARRPTRPPGWVSKLTVSGVVG